MKLRQWKCIANGERREYFFTPEVCDEATARAIACACFGAGVKGIEDEDIFFQEVG